MERNLSETSTQAAWPTPDRGDMSMSKHKRSDKRHGRKNKNSQQKALAGEMRADGVRVIENWREQPTAVIWARQPGEEIPAQVTEFEDHMSTLPKVELNTKQYNSSEHNADGWVDDFVSAPVIEHASVAAALQAREHEWANYDHEQAPEPRRFFWNEPEAQSPGRQEHEILPTVSGEEVAQESFNEPKESTDILDQAVNPNAMSGGPIIPEEQPVVKPHPQPPKTKTGFLGRRRAKPAVQSESMVGTGSFEQAPNSTAFNADAVAPFEAPDVLQQVPEQTDFVEAAMPNNLVESTDALEAEPEHIVPTPEIAEQITAPAPAEHVMEKDELLALAKSIRVDGVSVLEMFTAERIDETGLRRIVVAFLRGGELRQMISQEVIRQQMRFERDPQLRDTPVKTTKKDGKSAKRAAAHIKKHTRALLDMERAKDRTEQLAEFTQAQLEKAQTYIHENPNAKRTLSITAIVVIYAMILVIAFK